MVLGKTRLGSYGLALWGALGLLAPVPPHGQQDAGVKDTGVGSRRNPDDDGKHKVAGAFATKDVERQHREQRGQGGVNTPRQGLVDAHIHNLNEGQLLRVVHTKVFPNSVKHHNRIVDAEADDGQDGGNKQAIDFRMEERAKHGEHSQQEERVM